MTLLCLRIEDELYARVFLIALLAVMLAGIATHERITAMVVVTSLWLLFFAGCIGRCAGLSDPSAPSSTTRFVFPMGLMRRSPPASSVSLNDEVEHRANNRNTTSTKHSDVNLLLAAAGAQSGGKEKLPEQCGSVASGISGATSPMVERSAKNILEQELRST